MTREKIKSIQKEIIRQDTIKILKDLIDLMYERDKYFTDWENKYDEIVKLLLFTNKNCGVVYRLIYDISQKEQREPKDAVVVCNAIKEELNKLRGNEYHD